MRGPARERAIEILGECYGEIREGISAAAIYSVMLKQFAAMSRGFRGHANERREKARSQVGYRVIVARASLLCARFLEISLSLAIVELDFVVEIEKEMDELTISNLCHSGECTSE